MTLATCDGRSSLARGDKLPLGMWRRSVRVSSFAIALVVAGIAGIILGIVGAHTGNPTIGEQKWYWLVAAISVLPLVVGFFLFRSS
jgi:hypothetical protein